MRVTSDFFVTALVRKIFGGTGFAAIRKKGAAEAGAIFITVDRLDGSYDFYGPAPQAMFLEQPQGRLFERIFEKTSQAEITARLDREARMDPDFWVVDVEARDGVVDLPLAEAEPEAAKSGPDSFFKF